MERYRRRLPHVLQTESPVFFTWRLYGTLPAYRSFPGGTLSSGKQFAMLDRLLDKACAGPFYLHQPAIADLVVEAIHYNERVLSQYVLHTFVVMPNHVHLLISPRVPVPMPTKSLKGITALRANPLLKKTGNPFWQRESYDHEVRSEAEMERIRCYIERNPVKAGLVAEPSHYRWSSAYQLAK
jgi:putative transposase